METLFAVDRLDNERLGFGYLVFYGYDAVRHTESLPYLIDRTADAPPDLVVSFHQCLCLVDLGTAAPSSPSPPGPTCPGSRLRSSSI